MESFKLAVQEMIQLKPTIVTLLKRTPSWAYINSATNILDSLSSFDSIEHVFGSSVGCVKLDPSMTTLEEFMLLIDSLAVVRLWTMQEVNSFSFYDLVNLCFDGYDSFVGVVSDKICCVSEDELRVFYDDIVELQKILSFAIHLLSKYVGNSKCRVYRCCARELPNSKYFTSFTTDMSVAKSMLKTDPVLMTVELAKSPYILDIGRLLNLSVRPEEAEVLCVPGIIKHYCPIGEVDGFVNVSVDYSVPVIPEIEYLCNDIMCCVCMESIGNFRVCNAQTKYGHRLCSSCYGKIKRQNNLCPCCRSQMNIFSATEISSTNSQRMTFQMTKQFVSEMVIHRLICMIVIMVLLNILISYFGINQYAVRETLFSLLCFVCVKYFCIKSIYKCKIDITHHSHYCFRFENVRNLTNTKELEKMLVVKQFVPDLHKFVVIKESKPLSRIPKIYENSVRIFRH